MNKNVRKIVIAALLAAMTAVATYIIKFPLPLVGYVNFGDIIVLISGWLAGPVYGVLAAALGSAIADFMAGFVPYVPATFIIKGLVALAAYFIYKKLNNNAGLVISALIGEAVMVLGYFVFESVFLGLGIGAAASIPYNCIQGGVSLVCASLLFTALKKNSYIAKELKD